MNNVAIVYWSGTGNTEMMANSIAEGVKKKGAEAKLFVASDFNNELVLNFDTIAFGCPSMGAEQLEEDEFEPMFLSLEKNLKGKKIALFGSYGWGDGEWMRNWEEQCGDFGAQLACESVICTNEPDEDAKESCISMGEILAS